MFLFATAFMPAIAQKSLLQSGPMLGASEMREVLLWVQTKASAKVEIEYWEKGNSAKKFKTNSVQTAKENAFAAQLLADSVDYGKRYEYRLYINSKAISFDYPLEFQTPENWQWRKDPPPMKIAFGSCAYISDEHDDRPGKPYGGDYRIFTSIYEQKPDIMIWLGDNVYYRETDNTKTAMQRRNTQVRSLPELQPLLASTHHYAIWDDHDYGPNDSDRGFYNKRASLEVFKSFWANPTYGIEGEFDGVTTMFSWGDCDFFLMDNRYHRSPVKRKTGKKEILGEKQKQWLFDNLAFSKAKFKFVAIGGQFLNPIPSYENHSVYAQEREEIINFIMQENISNVIFLTGDRHFTEMAKIDRKGAFPLIDFTSSTLTAGVSTGACSNEKNFLRVEGTCVETRNFGLIEVSGKRNERVVKFSCIDTDGNVLWIQEFKEADYK